MRPKEWLIRRLRGAVGTDTLAADLKEHIDQRTREVIRHSQHNAAKLVASVSEDPLAFIGTLLSHPQALLHQVRELLPRCRDIRELPDVHLLIDEEIFPNLSWILVHPQFPGLDRAIQREFLQTIFSLLITTAHRKCPLVGDLLFGVFEEGLRRDEELPWLMELYDILYGLYWGAAADLASMLPFDRLVVRKLAPRVRQQFNSPADRPLRAGWPEDGLRVGYLCHYGDLAHGNAVAPIVSALVKKHCRQAELGHRVYLYTVQWYHDDFVRSFDGLPVSVRTFAVSQGMTEAEPLRQAVLADRIDVLITDISSATATYLFESRTAPLQLWLEMGYPFWSIANVDWTFLGHKSHRDYYGVDAGKCSTIRYGQERASMDRDLPPEQVELLRRRYLPGVRLLGTWCRLSKITPEYLALAERILQCNPAARLILAGSGDPTLIKAHLDHSPVADRIDFHPYSIDTNLYGRVIDVFLDTFPFCGGNACRIVGLFGKPVVAMWTAEWDRLMEESRDPELLARNGDQYVEKTTRLLTDDEFYRRCGQVARELSEQETDLGGALDEILRVIGQLWPQSAAGRRAA